MKTKQDLINLLKEKEKWVKNYVDKGKLDIEVYYDDDFTNIQRFKGRMKYYETIKEISILKQALEVIENIESQQTKPLEFVETDRGCKPISLTGITRCNSSKDKTADTPTLIKQALFQRNQEILEKIDNLVKKHTYEHRGCGDPSACCFHRINVLSWDFIDELKQQLNQPKTEK